jgi:hypothetical protein
VSTDDRIMLASFGNPPKREPRRPSRPLIVRSRRLTLDRETLATTRKDNSRSSLQAWGKLSRVGGR